MNTDTIESIFLGSAFLVALAGGVTGSLWLMAGAVLALAGTLFTTNRIRRRAPAGTPSEPTAPAAWRGDGVSFYGSEDDPC
jgi:hypothetical protein